MLKKRSKNTHTAITTTDAVVNKALHFVQFMLQCNVVQLPGGNCIKQQIKWNRNKIKNAINQSQTKEIKSSWRQLRDMFRFISCYTIRFVFVILFCTAYKHVYDIIVKIVVDRNCINICHVMSCHATFVYRKDKIWITLNTTPFHNLIFRFTLIVMWSRNGFYFLSK